MLHLFSLMKDKIFFLNAYRMRPFIRFDCTWRNLLLQRKTDFLDLNVFPSSSSSDHIGDLKVINHPLGQRASDSFTEGIPELYSCVQQNQILNVCCDLTITTIAKKKREKNGVRKIFSELKKQNKTKARLLLLWAPPAVFSLALVLPSVARVLCGENDHFERFIRPLYLC